MFFCSCPERVLIVHVRDWAGICPTLTVKCCRGVTSLCRLGFWWADHGCNWNQPCTRASPVRYPHVGIVAEALQREEPEMRNIYLQLQQHLWLVELPLLMHFAESIATILGMRLGEVRTYISSAWAQSHGAVRRAWLFLAVPKLRLPTVRMRRGICPAHESSGNSQNGEAFPKRSVSTKAGGHTMFPTFSQECLRKQSELAGAWFYTPSCTDVSGTPSFHSFAGVNVAYLNGGSAPSARNSFTRNNKKNPLTVWDHIHTAGLLFGAISFLV